MLVDKTKNVYFQNKMANKIYLGSKLIYEKGTGNLMDIVGYRVGSAVYMQSTPNPPNPKYTLFETKGNSVIGTGFGFIDILGNLKFDTLYSLFFTFNIQSGTVDADKMLIMFSSFQNLPEQRVSNYLLIDGKNFDSEFPSLKTTLTPYKDVTVRVVFRTPTESQFNNMSTSEKSLAVIFRAANSTYKSVLVKDVYLGEGVLTNIP